MSVAEIPRESFVVPSVADMVLYRGPYGDTYPAVVTGHHGDGTLDLVYFGGPGQAATSTNRVPFSPWEDAESHTWVHLNGVFVRGVDEVTPDSIFGGSL